MTNSDAENRDNLTGVLNYQAFIAGIDEKIADAERRNGIISLAMVDIDMFKKVNDEHGNKVGDEVLKSLAKNLTESISGMGAVYRYSRDEFAVLLPGIEKELAFLTLEKARSEFDREQTYTVDSKVIKLRVTVSIGIATYPEDGNRGQEIIRKAGDALYRSKAGGRNKVSLAREERMVTKTSHYTHGQLERLSQLAEREGVGEAILLREALDNLLHKYSV